MKWKLKLFCLTTCPSWKILESFIVCESGQFYTKTLFRRFFLCSTKDAFNKRIIHSWNCWGRFERFWRGFQAGLFVHLINYRLKKKLPNHRKNSHQTNPTQYRPYLQNIPFKFKKLIFSSLMFDNIKFKFMNLIKMVASSKDCGLIWYTIEAAPFLNNFLCYIFPTTIKQSDE